MRKIKHKYDFGRLNLVAGCIYESKFDYLTKSLSYKGSIPDNTFEWGFIGIEAITSGQERLLSGDLVKFRTTEEETVDKVTYSLDFVTLDNLVIAKSPFILHVPTGLIAFRPIQGKISINQFREFFCKVIMKANDDYFCDAQIQIIPDEAKILEYIRRFTIINNIKVSLHPSNPSSRKIWKDMDDDLKRLRADDYKVEYGSKSKKGIKIPEDGDITLSQIMMANDGYGAAEIRGETSEGKRIVSTESKPIHIEVSSDSEKSTIASVILEKFKEIMNRIKR